MDLNIESADVAGCSYKPRINNPLERRNDMTQFLCANRKFATTNLRKEVMWYGLQKKAPPSADA